MLVFYFESFEEFEDSLNEILVDERLLLWNGLKQNAPEEYKVYLREKSNPYVVIMKETRPPRVRLNDY